MCHAGDGPNEKISSGDCCASPAILRSPGYFDTQKVLFASGLGIDSKKEQNGNKIDSLSSNGRTAMGDVTDGCERGMIRRQDA